MGSGRFFGFVIGGALPAALAADWLVSAWDQNTGLAEPTPAASALEAVAGRWVLELLGLPSDSSFAFVTGCQMAHVTCLAAARQGVYERAGWDLGEQGSQARRRSGSSSAAERHVTVTRALRLLGIGSAQEVVSPTNEEGRMRRRRAREALDRRRAHDRLRPGRRRQHRRVRRPRGGRRRSRTTRRRVGPRGRRLRPLGGGEPLTPPSRRGHERADSWATDAHKWLNVPYDCGIAICAHPRAHEAAMEYAAPYLAVADQARAGSDGLQPRVLAAGALGARLGRDPLARTEGIGELVERSCAPRRRIADGARRLAGCEVLNDVVLNQVLVRFEDDERTRAIVAAVQEEGEAWMSPTVCDGRTAIRISVSAGGRPKTTSDARSTRSHARGPAS